MSLSRSGPRACVKWVSFASLVSRTLLKGANIEFIIDSIPGQARWNKRKKA